MADPKQLEFFLLRYVPDAVREEFVNIGLVAREAASGFAAVRITEDWSRVRCVDPEADLEVLTGLGMQVRSELRKAEDWEFVLKKLGDLLSNQVQVSAVKGCLAKDGAEEVEVLAKLYLEGKRAPASRMPSGRELILQGMEKALEEAGVLALLQVGVPAEKYTGSEGDPLKFDFAYSVSGAMRFLQAVSLKRDIHRATEWAWRFPEIRGTILNASGKEARLTAVIDDGLDRAQKSIRYATETFKKHGIQVAELAEMPRLAAEVRVELRA